MKKRRHNNMHRESKREDSSSHVKWFLFWFVVYGILIFLFELIKMRYNLFDKPVVNYLVLGLFLRVISKFVFCAVKKRTFSFRGIISWTIIYTLLLFIIDFILNQFNNLTNQYTLLAITSAIFTILVMFLRRARMKVGMNNKGRFRRAPSQIFTGIALIVLGILCWRFSATIFLNWLGWVEGLAWSVFIGLALIIAGILVLIAYWRNNVANFNFHGHWWNH